MSTTTFSSSSYSAAAAALPPPLPTSPPAGPTSLALNLSSLGLGLAIVIALGFLALLSTILFASYVCCRAASRRRSLNPPDHLNLGPDNGVYLPRVIFVAQDDDDDDENDPSQNAVVGLHPAAINSYPKFPYSKTGTGGGGGNDSVCSICLCEYRDGEMLRMLPDCRHFFHLTCLDPWLKLNASCPVCRNSPLPTPVSTPLSEVVPLSQYSDGRRR